MGSLTTPTKSRRAARRLWAGALASSIAVASLVAIPAGALAASVPGPNGTTLTVTPTEIDDLTNEVTLTVSGTGYSTTKNNGFGVYVSFGPEPVGPRAGNVAFTDIARYYNGGDGHGTLWVTPGTPSGPNQAKLQTDGSFSIQVAAKASYVGGSTTYDGTTQQLGVLTYAAHGTEASAADGDSQFVFVPVDFNEPTEPATAPAAPAKPTAASTAPTTTNVSWTAPADGGSAITGYTVTVRNGSGTVTATSATVGAVTSTTISGLTADTSYNVVVAATNAVGTGSASPASDVFRTPPTAVPADFDGLRWKISHQAWTSSSLSTPHELVAPAEKTADGFLFPQTGEGAYDPATGVAHATFSGTASLGNTAQGGYRIWFADPIFDVDAEGNGSVSANVSYRTSAAGAVSTPVRVTVVTFDVDPSDVVDGEGHVVFSVAPTATFASAFIDALAPSLRGHFQPTGGATDPLKAPSPLSAGFDYPVVDDPTSEVVVITTDVVETGALVLSVEDTSISLTSPALDPNGDLFAVGELNEVKVVDLRSSNPGWNVTGQVGDFDGPGDAIIDGAGLSWAPEVVSSSPGQTVTPGAAGDGLKAGQVLGSAGSGQGRGTSILGGSLTLEVPSTTPPGSYGARLTLTAI